MTSTERPTVRLQPRAHKRVAHGHPWAFSNEIAMGAAERGLDRGGLVRLETDHGVVLGTAMFNPHSLIAARLLARDPQAPIDQDWFMTRLARAARLRDTLYGAPYYRLVHAEGDDLPGLVIDRYGDVFTVQMNAAGMDRLAEPLLGALAELFQPRGILLRNDSPVRVLEGLETITDIAQGEIPTPVELEENGARFHVDLAEGQKTGWFYDQRENRAFAASLARGRRVLDLYAYAGGFAIACAMAGAAHVTAIDRSARAVELAKASAQQNRVHTHCAFHKADVFTTLEARRGEKFGLVIVDPPAFVKSRKDLAAGLAGYRKLARMAAALVEPEGFLCFASCSHHVERARFLEEAARGLREAGRNGRLLRAAGAAADHPVHPMLPETAYLKTLFFQLD